MNAWIVGGVYVAVVASLLLRLRASWAFVGGAAVLLVLGQLRPEEWLAAAVNPSLLVLWVLLIAATAIESRFRLESLMPRSGSFGSRLALIWGTGLISTFMNNTAVVALLMAPLRRWAPRQGLSPAVVLMPMAFAATLGGVVTVIGTSTNLVLNGLIRASGTPELGSWDYLIPGLAVLSLGGLYLTWAGRRMFADRALASAARESARPYTVETRLRPGAPEVGQSVERAGFRQLLGLYLVEIQRGAQLIAPVAPGEMLHEGDRLFFAGELEQVDELLRSRTGLALPRPRSRPRPTRRRWSKPWFRRAARSKGSRCGNRSFGSGWTPPSSACTARANACADASATSPSKAATCSSWWRVRASASAPRKPDSCTS